MLLKKESQNFIREKRTLQFNESDHETILKYLEHSNLTFEEFLEQAARYVISKDKDFKKVLADKKPKS